MTDRAELMLREHPAIYRVLIGGLGLVQTIDGLYALFAPSSFYGDFPAGRGWVEALPAYNEHLVRDVGGLFLATGVLLLIAAWRLDRSLVRVALGTFLLFAIPHFVYHVFNLEPYDAADTIANVLTLGLTVIPPVAMLWTLRPGTVPAPGPGAAAPVAEGNGRMAGVPESTRNPFIRAAYRSSRGYGAGEVQDPVKLFAHHPTLLAGYGAFEMATERSHAIDDRLEHLVMLRAAMLGGCEWCLDYGSAISAANEVDDEDLKALPGYRESDRFDETEKLALDLATGMSLTPVEVGDELFERLRERFDERQLVQLVHAIAIENYRARFNWAFGLAGQGFAEGAYCVRPEAPAAAADTATP